MSTKITLGSKTKAAIKCSHCGKDIPAGEQYTFKGKDGNDLNFCSDCKAIIDQELVQETQNIPYFKAILGGLVGAFLGGLLWFVIELVTGYQIGYVAIGVGYLVLQGIGRASGHKKGTKLQIMGLILTLLAIVGAQYALGVYYIMPEAVKEFPHDSYLFQLSVSLLAAGTSFFSYAVSPIGLFIWGIALYIVYRGLKPVKI